MRKGFLCIAVLSFGLIAATASAKHNGDPNKLCHAEYNKAGEDLKPGVYPPSKDGAIPANKGKFVLGTSPSKAGAVGEVTGGALICGTDPLAATPVFVKSAVISYPNRGEQVRCGRPGTSAQCDKVKPYVADQTVTGSTQSDTLCMSTNPKSLCNKLGGLPVQGVTSVTKVRHRSSPGVTPFT